MNSTLSPPAGSVPQTVDERLARLEGIIDQAPALLAAVTDTVDELSARLADTGAPVDQRANGLAVLADQFTRPETTRAMARIAAQFEALESSIAALTNLPLAMAAITDVIDEAAQKLSNDGVALDQVGSRVKAAACSAAVVIGSSSFEQGPEKIGLFGLLKALRDPDVQRALGMAIRVARAVGKSINPENSTKELTRG